MALRLVRFTETEHFASGVIDFTVQERVRRDHRRKQSIHAAMAVLVGVVRLLKHRSVADGFIAAHPEAEGVAEEDLLHSFAVYFFFDCVFAFGCGIGLIMTISASFFSSGPGVDRPLLMIWLRMFFIVFTRSGCSACRF